MKFGYYLPTNGPLARKDPIVKIAKHSESLGFDSMVAGDHVVAPIDPESQYPYSVSSEVPWNSSGEHLDVLAELAFLAAATEKARLVTSVLIVPQRNPVVTAKMLSTIDVLSEGRLVVGVGVGWLKEEFDALDTAPFERRGSVTDEYLEIFKTLWFDENPSFSGNYYSFDSLQFSPKPLQRPGPPIWVGGQSRAAIRRSVRYGEAWHPVGANPASPLEPDQLSADVRYMHSYCEQIGKDPADLTVVMKAPIYDRELISGGERRRFSGQPEQIIDDIRIYSDLGVSQLILDTRSPDLNEFIEKLDWLSENVMSQTGGL